MGNQNNSLKKKRSLSPFSMSYEKIKKNICPIMKSTKKFDKNVKKLKKKKKVIFFSYI